jgi:hypothetical protein
MRWVEPIKGERSGGIAVIGLDDPTLAEALIANNGYCMDAETALRRFARMPFIDHKVPEDFRRTFTRADLEKKLGQRVEYDAPEVTQNGWLAPSASSGAPASSGPNARNPMPACRSAARISRCVSSWRTNSSKLALHQRR